MTIIYRDGLVEDAAALDRLYDTVFCDTFAHLYRPDDLGLFLTSYGVEDWQADLADPACAFRVAQSGGELVGYVKLGPNRLPIEAGGPGILLDQFYVATEHHGAGIARELMDWAIGEARRRGAKHLYLTVYVDNHRARRFYDRYGFEPVGRYDFKVGNHVDEDVIMRKVL